MIKEEKLQFIDENSTGMKLKRGVVKLYRMESEGREITVALLGPGDIFGGISAFDRKSYGEFAKAVEDVFICAVNRKVFFERMSKNPTVMLRLNRFLGLIVSRVSSVLLRLLDKFGDERGYIKIALTHKDIATMVGATREAHDPCPEQASIGGSC